MAICTYINMDAVREYMLSNPHATKDQAMEYARCKNDAVKGHLRCSEHGAGDLVQFYARDMRPDEKDRFVDLYKNMTTTYNIDEGNQYVCNIVAMTCREVIMSHDADPGEMLSHIQNAVALGRDLAVNPKEQKGQQINIKTDVVKDTEQINAIVRARMETESTD